MSGVRLFKDNLAEEQLVKLGLNQRQVKAVLYVKENGKITNSEYQKLNDTTTKTSFRDFGRTVEIEYITKIGRK